MERDYSKLVYNFYNPDGSYKTRPTKKTAKKYIFSSHFENIDNNEIQDIAILLINDIKKISNKIEVQCTKKGVSFYSEFKFASMQFRQNWIYFEIKTPEGWKGFKIHNKQEYQNLYLYIQNIYLELLNCPTT